MSFGEQLREARKRAGLTQAQLGAMLDVSDCTVTSWEKETRQPDIPALRKLTQILGVSADALLETGFIPSKREGASAAPPEKLPERQQNGDKAQSSGSAAVRLGIFLSKAGYIKDEHSITDKQLTAAQSMLEVIFGSPEEDR